jgi:phage shock protein A
MGFFARVWGYIKAAVTGGVESRMKPEIQLEQAIADARKQDLALRNQAARVIAHRTEVQMKLDRAIDDAATAREQAGQALRNADAATKAGNAEDVDRWTRAATAIAMKLESAESLVASLKAQYETATHQAELAKTQANDNAMRLQELSAKRMELLGKIEQAKMQEQVNATMAQLSKPVDVSGPTIAEIEDKVNSRMALASAKAELESSSVEGAQRDVERSMAQASAEARLGKLREELGIAAPAAEPAQVEAPAAPVIEPPAGETAT